MARYSEADAPIKKDDMMPLMLEACPSFLSEWGAFLDYWAESDDPPLYLALFDLALHVTAMIDRNELSTMPAIFDVVERWHVEGDSYVRGAAAAGFLEGIVSWKPEDRNQQKKFKWFLLPETRRSWDALHGA